MPSTEAHVRIEFGGIALDYRADRDTAIMYADEISEQLHIDAITIDDGPTDGLTLLPCSDLWR